MSEGRSPEETRAAILAEMKRPGEPVSTPYIAEEMGEGVSLIAYHLAVLRDEGSVVMDRTEGERLYRLTGSGA